MLTASTCTRGITRLMAALAATLALSSASASASADSFVTRGQSEDPYRERVEQQIAKINLTAGQVQPFQELLRQYYGKRNGATRRISRQGGNIPVKVRRDLRRVARRSVQAMFEVLMPEQLKHYEKLMEICNEQYMTDAGLR